MRESDRLSENREYALTNRHRETHMNIKDRQSIIIEEKILSFAHCRMNLVH